MLCKKMIMAYLSSHKIMTERECEKVNIMLMKLHLKKIKNKNKNKNKKII